MDNLTTRQQAYLNSRGAQLDRHLDENGKPIESLIYDSHGPYGSGWQESEPLTDEQIRSCAGTLPTN